MKKLMTAIAAVTAAFGLYAADPVEALHGASMEADENYIVGEGVFSDDVWDGYWASDGDADAAIVKEYGEEVAPEHLDYDCFNGATQLNYLKLETEAPLYRAIDEATGKGADNLVQADIAVAGERDGVMIDQLVKFTAFEAETEAVSLDGNEKIAVWVKADADDDTKGTLQIATAQMDENGEPVVTNVNTEKEIDLAKWYQLKITAVVAANVDTDAIPGFMVELDGETIAMADGLWGEALTDYITEIAEPLIAENKLFPSMVAYSAANSGTLVGIAYKGTGAIDDVAVANYVAEEPAAGEAEVNGQAYPTIALAIAAAEDGQEVKILKNVDLADTLVINKAITLDLNKRTIKLAADKTVGIDITADAEISNGSITSTLEANVVGSKAINIPNKNVTLTDVDIDASFYEYAIYANCDDDCGGNLAWFYTDTEEKFATLTCDGVSIVGNGSLFHIEGMIATLNNCEATYDGNELFANEAHRAAVYSSVNAGTTITGSGTYDHENALQSGNLGGKITVDADSTAEFTGNIKSYMKVGAHPELEDYEDYVAQFTFNGGTYKGTIVFVDEAARDLDLFVKGEAVGIEPPKGYQWNEETGVLEPIPEPTDFTVNYESGEGTTLTVTTEDGTIVEDGELVPVGTKLTIAAELEDGYKNARIFVNENPFESGETYTVDGDIMITSSADALETWNVIVDSFDETQVESLTATPEEVREDAEDKTVTLEAVFKEGFELDHYTVNGLPIDGDTFQIEADTLVGVVAKSVGGGWDPTVDPTVPASDKGIEGKLANASFKDLSTWAQNNSVEFKAGNMDEYADAFLLDCDPDDVEEEAKNFKFASITQNAEGEWVVEINNEEIRGGQHFYGNGIAIITRYSDVTCETPADDGNFFKASLEVYSVATPE